jgi:transposase InsO family protein
MKFVFIEDNRSEFRVERMCQALRVSRSGYYKWKNRPKSKQTISNEELLKMIKEIYHKHKGRYGSPRIWKELKARGIDCGKNRVARLMRINDIKSKRAKRFKATTNSKHNHPVAPNLLNQDFTVDQPNTILVSDITYVWTFAGWLYLCVILDLFNRQVVGWSISSRMTQDLVLNALDQMIKNQRPAPGLIFHSDRGSQYAATKVRELIKKHQVVQSMSKKGDCFDNAVAESFFATLKTECVYQQVLYSRDQAISEIFEYIEIYYNRQRIHSTNNFQTPISLNSQRKVA